MKGENMCNVRRGGTRHQMLFVSATVEIRKHTHSGSATTVCRSKPPACETVSKTE